MRGTDFIRGSVVAVVLAVGASPAMAYVDSGTDLQGDNSGAVDGVGDYDIRSTTRSVVQGPHRKNLRIGVRTYEADFQAPSYVIAEVKLDARGGRRADAILEIWVLDQSGTGCELETRTGRPLRRGTFQFIARSDASGEDLPAYFGIGCRVPVYRLHPTKEIRWRVSLTHGGAEMFDRAPNEGEGMYS
jgi:hypothetical protein